MGSYINKNLVPGEIVEFTTKYHWIIFFSLKSLLTLFIYPIYLRWTDEFGITNRRVIIKTGLIARRTMKMNISKIETVNVDQTVMGRFLGFGTIRLVGSGGSKEVFHRIKRPIEFRKKFQEVQYQSH